MAHWAIGFPSFSCTYSAELENGRVRRLTGGVPDGVGDLTGGGRVTPHPHFEFVPVVVVPDRSAEGAADPARLSARSRMTRHPSMPVWIVHFLPQLPSGCFSLRPIM